MKWKSKKEIKVQIEKGNNERWRKKSNSYDDDVKSRSKRRHTIIAIGAFILLILPMLDHQAEIRKKFNAFLEDLRASQCSFKIFWPLASSNMSLFLSDGCPGCHCFHLLQFVFLHRKQSFSPTYSTHNGAKVFLKPNTVFYNAMISQYIFKTFDSMNIS